MNRTIIVQRDSKDLTTRVIEALDAEDGLLAARDEAVLAAERAEATVPFLDRAEAEATHVQPYVQFVNVGGQFYERDPAGTDLTTADGATWTRIVNPDAAENAAIRDKREFRDLPTLLANAALAYGAGAAQVQAGDIIRTRAEGFAYRVLALGSTPHVATAGGVLLEVLPVDGAYYPWAAWAPVNDGVTDNYGKLRSAGDACRLNNIAGLFLPAGNYFVGQEFIVDWRAEIQGAGGTNWQASREICTNLYFPAGTNGIRVPRANTSASGGDGGWSNISRLALRCIGSNANSTGHGVVLDARAYFDDVAVHGFPEDGFNVTATAPDRNANNFRFVNCRSTDNGRDGFFMSGADANAGSLIGCDASGNGRINFNDSSFLGNGLAFCHSSSPGKRAYARGSDGQGYRCKVDHVATADTIPVTGADWSVYWEVFASSTTYALATAGTKYYDSRAGKTAASGIYHYFSGNANSTTTFLCCYSEGTGGTTESSYLENDRKSLIGGTGMSVDFPNSRGRVMGLPFSTTTYENNSAPSSNNRITTKIGGDSRYCALSFQSYVSGSSGTEFVLGFDPPGKRWYFGTPAQASRCYYLMEQGNSHGLPVGMLDFTPQGVAISSKVHIHRAAAPTSGTWRRGDRIYALSPSAAGTEGWVCTTAGEAGSTAVFKTFGSIEA